MDSHRVEPTPRIHSEAVMEEISPPVTVREFADGDRDTLVALMNDFGDEWVALDPLRRLVRDDGYGEHFVDAIIDEVRRGSGIALVADAGGSIVGFGAGTVRTAHGAELLEVVPTTRGRITELYLTPTFRRRGLGARIVREFEERFRARGCDVVRIEVFAPNHGGREFYRSLGYAERDVDLIKPLD